MDSTEKEKILKWEQVTEGKGGRGFSRKHDLILTIGDQP